MVVGVEDGVVAAAAAQDFNGAVGDDLVGIHMEADAGAGLVHVHHELVVEGAAHDLFGGLDDGTGAALVQQAQFPVGERGRLLDHSHRLDEARVGVQTADGVVLDRALRLDAVVSVSGHLFFSQRIFLNAVAHCYLLPVTTAG